MSTPVQSQVTLFLSVLSATDCIVPSPVNKIEWHDRCLLLINTITHVLLSHDILDIMLTVKQKLVLVSCPCDLFFPEEFNK